MQQEAGSRDGTPPRQLALWTPERVEPDSELPAQAGYPAPSHPVVWRWLVINGYRDWAKMRKGRP